MWCLKRLMFDKEIHIDKEEFTIGRNPKADLVCVSPFVSRNHAALKICSNKLYVKDFNSTNGMYVNEEKITSNSYVLLKKNDILGLGTSIEEKDSKYHLYKIFICQNCSSFDHKNVELMRSNHMLDQSNLSTSNENLNKTSTNNTNSDINSINRVNVIQSDSSENGESLNNSSKKKVDNSNSVLKHNDVQNRTHSVINYVDRTQLGNEHVSRKRQGANVNELIKPKLLRVEIQTKNSNIDTVSESTESSSVQSESTNDSKSDDAFFLLHNNILKNGPILKHEESMDNNGTYGGKNMRKSCGASKENLEKNSSFCTSSKLLNYFNSNNKIDVIDLTDDNESFSSEKHILKQKPVAQVENNSQSNSLNNSLKMEGEEEINIKNNMQRLSSNKSTDTITDIEYKNEVKLDDSFSNDSQDIEIIEDIDTFPVRSKTESVEYTKVPMEEVCDTDMKSNVDNTKSEINLVESNYYKNNSIKEIDIKCEIKQENNSYRNCDDSDIFICSQLFDDNFKIENLSQKETNAETSQHEEYDMMLLSLKKDSENDEVEPDVIELSDDDGEEENRWFARLSQNSSFNNWPKISCKSENILDEDYNNILQCSDSYSLKIANNESNEIELNDLKTKLVYLKDNEDIIKNPRKSTSFFDFCNINDSDSSDSNQIPLKLNENVPILEQMEAFNTHSSNNLHAKEIDLNGPELIVKNVELKSIVLTENDLSEFDTLSKKNSTAQQKEEPKVEKIEKLIINSSSIILQKNTESMKSDLKSEENLVIDHLSMKAKKNYVLPPIIEPPTILNKYHRQKKEEHEKKLLEKKKLQDEKRKHHEQIKKEKAESKLKPLEEKKTRNEKHNLKSNLDIIKHTDAMFSTCTVSIDKASTVGTSTFYKKSPNNKSKSSLKSVIKKGSNNKWKNIDKKSPLKKNYKKEKNSETRKEKLKQIALEQKSSKNVIDERKIITKPKIKVTKNNRSDALVADIVGTNTEAIVSKPTIKLIDIFKDVNISHQNYKIPKNKSSEKNENSNKTNKSVKNNRSSKLSKESENMKEKNNELDEKINTVMTKKVDNMNINSLIKDVKSILTKEIKDQKRIKKKVKFILEPTIQEFEIEDGNSLHPCNFKDAPMPKKPISFPDSNTTQNLSITKTEKTNSLKKNKYLSIEDIIYHITKWNPEWLLNDENGHLEEMPLINVLSQYLSYEDYYNVFIPLMYNELWSYITKEWNFRIHSDRSKKMVASITRVADYLPDKLKNKLMLIDCHVILNSEDYKNKLYPCVGDLTIVHLNYLDPQTNTEESYSTFAYVKFVTKQLIRGTERFLVDLLNEVPQPSHAVYMSILLPFRNSKIILTKGVPLRVILKMSSSLRQFKSIIHLPLSSLSQHILRPQLEHFKLPDYEIDSLFTNHQLNKSQMDAVFKTCEACLQREAKLCLIQGPPGTGKSFVIINLILQLLYGKNRYVEAIKNKRILPRILLCAPSNAAIDSLTLKLLNIRKDIDHSRFKMVRYGQLNNMHKDVHGISAEFLGLAHLKSEMKNLIENGSLREERNTLQAKINSLENQLMGAPTNAYVLQKRLNEYKRCLEALPKEGNNLREFEENRRLRQSQQLVLRNADIVCTTLSSCFTDLMESLKDIPECQFTCCIVDEASQCSEPDTLIPLMLGIKTLVLVGDPCQLQATVLSQRAKRFGYGQSLFMRLEKTLSDKPDNCIQFLNVQYRMHPDISLWPNSFFYNNRIQNSPELLKSRECALVPYRILNHNFLQTSNEENVKEAEFTALLAVEAKKLTEDLNLSISIITPYRKQKNCIEKYLAKQAVSIEVNTIDAFQGQERDIVFFSCVRTDGIGFLIDNERINVALTRAKYSLIIIVNFQSLQGDYMWRSLKENAESRNLLYKVSLNINSDQYKCMLLK